MFCQWVYLYISVENKKRPGKPAEGRQGAEKSKYIRVRVTHKVAVVVDCKPFGITQNMIQKKFLKYFDFGY